MKVERCERVTFAQLIAEGALEIGDGYRAKNDKLGGDGLIFLRAGHVTDSHIDFEGVQSWKIPPVLITPHGPYRKARTVGTSGTECCGTAGTIGTIGTLGTGVAEVGDEGLNGTFGRTGTERNGGTIGTARRAE